VSAETVVGRARRTHGQRERLLEALTALVGEFGYPELKLGQLVARAEVSRQAFYRLFADKDSCFLAAFNPAAGMLLDSVRSATVGNEPSRATEVAVETLVAFATAEPDTALLVLGESLRGGTRVRRAREQLLTSLAGIIDHAQAGVPLNEPFPDVPPRLACGVTCRLLASRLRHNETLDELSSEIGAWLKSYKSPRAKHRWSSLASSPPADRSPFLPRRPLAPPPAEHRPRGRSSRTPADEDWLRIAFATVEIVERDGYESATVAEIARRAGVEPRMFYATFAGKQQSLAAAQELLFRHLIAVAAGAFVAGDSWSARLWEAARAVTQCAEQNAALTRVSLLHPCVSDASGRGLPQDVTAAFTVFLQEGGRGGEEEGLGSTALISASELQAIITAIADLAFGHVQVAPDAPLTDLLARVVFLATAPFLGTADAARLAKHGSPTPSTPHGKAVSRRHPSDGGRAAA
jgi:AcrR family transcriptional regulator